ncbi:MAG: hypothetical protein J6P98_03070, partial [Clostridia bacterium]|nr:hypothetical protein [Clostridia bacterium]
MKPIKQIIKRLLCLAAASMLAIAAGCVKTPEGEAVTAKTKIDGLHVGEVKSEDGSLTPQELDQPEHITESWAQALGDPDFGGTGGGQKLEYTVNIDADVIVPVSGIFPVYGVAKAKYMNEDLFDRFVDVLFEGCEGKYCAPDARSYEKGCFDSDDRFVGSPCYVNGVNIQHDLELFQGQGSLSGDQNFDHREYLLFTASEERTLCLNVSGGGGDVIGLPEYVFDRYGSGEDLNEGKEDLPSYVLELLRSETSPEDA